MARVLRVVSEIDFQLLEEMKKKKNGEEERLEERMLGRGEQEPKTPMLLHIDPRNKIQTLNSVMSQLKRRESKGMWKAWKILSALFDSPYTSWTPRGTIVYLGEENNFSNIVSLLDLLLDLDPSYFKLPGHSIFTDNLTLAVKVSRALGKALTSFITNSIRANDVK